MNQVHATKRCFCCAECALRFATSSDLRRRVHEKLQHRCGICHKCFASKSYLNQHIRRVHNEDKGYACSKCQYVSTTEANLRRHVSVVHDGNRSIECDKCTAHFGCKTDLQNHVRYKHANVRHLCKHCGRSIKDLLRRIIVVFIAIKWNRNAIVQAIILTNYKQSFRFTYMACLHTVQFFCVLLSFINNLFMTCCPIVYICCSCFYKCRY